MSRRPAPMISDELRRVLRAMLAEPDRSWPAAELAERLGLGPQQVSLCLLALTGCGWAQARRITRLTQPHAPFLVYAVTTEGIRSTEKLLDVGSWGAVGGEAGGRCWSGDRPDEHGVGR